MPAIVLDQAAKADLIEIWQYIAGDNPIPQPLTGCSIGYGTVFG